MFTKPKPANTNPEDKTDEIENKFAELKALIDGPASQDEMTRMSEIELQYRNCLLENVREGVLFVDNERKITCWNSGAEMITGLVASNIVGCEFTPDLLGLAESDGRTLSRVNCPVATTRSVS